MPVTRRPCSGGDSSRAGRAAARPRCHSDRTPPGRVGRRVTGAARHWPWPGPAGTAGPGSLIRAQRTPAGGPAGSSEWPAESGCSGSGFSMKAGNLVRSQRSCIQVQVHASGMPARCQCALAWPGPRCARAASRGGPSEPSPKPGPPAPGGSALTKWEGWGPQRSHTQCTRPRDRAKNGP